MHVLCALTRIQNMHKKVPARCKIQGCDSPLWRRLQVQYMSCPNMLMCLAASWTSARPRWTATVTHASCFSGSCKGTLKSNNPGPTSIHRFENLHVGSRRHAFKLVPSLTSSHIPGRIAWPKSIVLWPNRCLDGWAEACSFTGYRRGNETCGHVGVCVK